MKYPWPEPTVLTTEVFTQLPESMRKKNISSLWAKGNRRGANVDSFIEGPSFDKEGNLWFVDIPYGRIFCANKDGKVELITEYDGQPNGLKIHKNGNIYIADYKNGIMSLDPRTGKIKPVLEDCDLEGFKGCNDLHFDKNGAIYFTDQGQTGLQDPSGVVYKWNPDTNELKKLINNVPSPNGLVLDLSEQVLYLAVTRANAVWKLPISNNGVVNKAGLFLQFSGGRSGPDGLALTSTGGVVVCQTGMGLVWIHDSLGRPIAVIQSSKGLGTTNCAFGGEGLRTLYITESDSGTILKTTFPSHLNISGNPMYSGFTGH